MPGFGTGGKIERMMLARAAGSQQAVRAPAKLASPNPPAECACGGWALR